MAARTGAARPWVPVRTAAGSARRDCTASWTAPRSSRPTAAWMSARRSATAAPQSWQASLGTVWGVRRRSRCDRGLRCGGGRMVARGPGPGGRLMGRAGRCVRRRPPRPPRGAREGAPARGGTGSCVGCGLATGTAAGCVGGGGQAQSGSPAKKARQRGHWETRLGSGAGTRCPACLMARCFWNRLPCTKSFLQPGKTQRWRSPPERGCRSRRGAAGADVSSELASSGARGVNLEPAGWPARAAALAAARSAARRTS